MHTFKNRQYVHKKSRLSKNTGSSKSEVSLAIQGMKDGTNPGICSYCVLLRTCCRTHLQQELLAYFSNAGPSQVSFLFWQHCGACI